MTHPQDTIMPQALGPLFHNVIAYTEMILGMGVDTGLPLLIRLYSYLVPPRLWRPLS